MNISVIIPAAGGSSRFNETATGLDSHRSKLDAVLGGRPVLHRTVELFTKRDEVGSIIVAGPYDPAAMTAFCERHADKLAILGIKIVAGGEQHRWQTVRAALDHVSEGATHIAVHDAARPGTPEALLDRLFEAAERHAAVIPGLSVHDSVKRAEAATDIEQPADPLAAILGDAGAPKNDLRRITETVEREGLVLAQTPQVFERALLERAYAQDDLTGTDDAALVERLGEPVLVVAGDPRNMKITKAEDVRTITALLGLRGAGQRSAHKRF